ncbi:MAG: copper-binding protein [Myxococcota bacterium]|jgi:Cu/Ag efflux protein CusF|nr:copper-binding protein [Myxococcota bacterium]
MKVRIRFALAALALVVAACQGSSPVRGTGEGKVVSIDAAHAEITIEHGDIEGVMKAMTMPFTVSDPRLLEGLAPGAAIEFDVEQRGERHFVTAIRRR